MNNGETVKKAIKQLPDPSTYKDHYIDIHVPSKVGYHVVTFAKTTTDGVVTWMALPYAR